MPPPFGFCGCGVCGVEPDDVVDDTAVDDGAAEGLDRVAGCDGSGTWKGTAIMIEFSPLKFTKFAAQNHVTIFKTLKIYFLF